MAITYPTSLDSLTNPAGTDYTGGATLHSVQHSNANDAIEALEAKLGIGASTPALGKLLKGSGAGASAWLALGTALQQLRMNVGGTDVEFYTPAHVRVTNSGAQSIANGTATPLTFDQEIFDNDTMHSTSSNTSRLVATTPGLYIIGGHCTFDTNATGLRALYIQFNGTGANLVESNVAKRSDNYWNGVVVTIYRLTAGQYVEMSVYQDSGGSLNVLAGTQTFWMGWLGA